MKCETCGREMTVIKTDSGGAVCLQALSGEEAMSTRDDLEIQRLREENSMLRAEIILANKEADAARANSGAPEGTRVAELCPQCRHPHSGDCVTCAWRVADERAARIRQLEADLAQARAEVAVLADLLRPFMASNPGARSDSDARSIAVSFHMKAHIALSTLPETARTWIAEREEMREALALVTIRKAGVDSWLHIGDAMLNLGPMRPGIPEIVEKAVAKIVAALDGTAAKRRAGRESGV